jgi:glycosyltransferase involved in cell wall biosynthesis
MKRICFVTTSPLIVNFFLRPHLLHLRERFQVTLAVTQPGEVPLLPLPGIEVAPLAMRRKFSPLHDMITLAQLTILFRRRFDLVHSFSPKAGLLAGVAALLARVPARVHTFTGQVWATKRAVSRRLLRLADQVTARCASHVLADSNSQRDFLIAQHIVASDKCRVLASGSVAGVDPGRFKPDPKARASLRQQLQIPEQAPVILFLGRMTRDKGVLDLAAAFSRLLQSVPDALLLIVGPDEEGLRGSIERTVERTAHLRFADYTAEPERFLAAADVLCLPSYREGFGNVIIEAAACGLPAVSTRIYGVTDALLENHTGLLFAPGNVEELRRQLAHMLTDGSLRRKLGQAARARAVSSFAQPLLTRALEDFYVEILGG